MSLFLEEIAYHYTSLLEADSIRLIELHPCPDMSAQVKCSIIHTTLKHAREDIIDHYTALSYVWGDAEDRMPIRVGNLHLHVTRNLDDALRHIRDATRMLYVWADAVCINQNDLMERNQQVAQMGEIYQTAHHTVIFLGSCDILTEQSLWRALKEWHMKEAEIPIYSQNSITKLLERPWFYRVWILQELVLSSDPRVQCGKFRCTWDQFYKLALMHDYEEPVTEPLSPNRHIERRSDILVGMQSGREFYRTSKDTFHSTYTWKRFIGVLNSRRGLGVTDDRDMIFAHLGMFEGTNFQVDYRLSLTEILETFAMKYDQVVNGMDYIVCHREYIDPNQRRPGLASWAPDWTSNSKPLAMKVPQMPPGITAFLCSTYEKKFGFAEYRFLQAPNLICSGAYTLSTISALSCKLENLDLKSLGKKKSARQWYDSRIQWWTNYFEKDKKFLTHTLRISRQLRASTLYDAFNDRTPGNPKSTSSRTWPCVVAELIVKHHGEPSIIDDRRVALLSSKPMPRYSMPVGGHLALVPTFSQPGDQICLLPGYRFPLVMRDFDGSIDQGLDRRVRILLKEPESSQRTVKHVTIIGECFVDRIHRDGREYIRPLVGGEELLAIH